jgi:hypothetical protein
VDSDEVVVLAVAVLRGRVSVGAAAQALGTTAKSAKTAGTTTLARALWAALRSGQYEIRKVTR